MLKKTSLSSVVKEVLLKTKPFQVKPEVCYFDFRSDSLIDLINIHVFKQILPHHECPENISFGLGQLLNPTHTATRTMIDLQQVKNRNKPHQSMILMQDLIDQQLRLSINYFMDG